MTKRTARNDNDTPELKQETIALVNKQGDIEPKQLHLRVLQINYFTTGDSNLNLSNRVSIFTRIKELVYFVWLRLINKELLM